MKITIGVLAHVDAGKTTFSEQILWRAKALRTAGRVDHQDAFLDMHPLEKSRGITIFSDQARFDYGGKTWYWVDTPGHVDFSSEMERAISVMDAAIIVVSCVEGVQSHTETVWRLLRRYGVPTFFFLNKTDRQGADPNRVIDQIRRKLTAEVLDLRGAMQADGSLSESAAEAVAAGDERLMEAYFDTGYDRDLWLESLRRQAMERKLFPLTAGSALRGEGVGEALDMLCLIVETDYEIRAGAPLRGVAQKVRFDDQGNKLTFVKLTQGRIRVRDEIQTPDGPAKISEIRLYHGTKYTAVPQAESGDIAALAGVQGIRPGDAVGEDCRRGSFATSPLMTAEVLWPQEIHPTRMLEILRRLEEEEPMLGVTWNEASRSIEVQVLGRIQLDVLRALVKERSGVEIDFGACRPRYMETIAGTTYGIGHYEPLRHYAEVHLRLDPLPRGSGVVFESACHVDTLALNWQRLIETHIFEKTHRGVLVGAPLTDVRVTLLTGRDHLKHTEGGDFREATYRALRNALMRGQCVLLEPVCRFDLRVPEDDFGRVMGDLNRLKAQVDPPVFSDGEAQMTGEAPFQLLSDYSESLAAMTHGRGAFSWRLDHYSPCREAEKVVAAANYNPYADGSPDSVFCAKGAGYTVAWDKVRDFAHLESEATEIVKT